MALTLPDAVALIRQAERDVRSAVQQISAARDGSIPAARNRVAAVRRGGFDLSELANAWAALDSVHVELDAVLETLAIAASELADATGS